MNETLDLSDKKRFAPSADVLPTEVTVDEELQNALTSIPEKMAFKIGEVSELVGVKPYVLRYWESEFDALNPKKSRHNQRVYQKRDVELVMMIKKLLYRDRYSIEGARSALKGLKKDKKKAQALQEAAHKMESIRLRMEDVLDDIGRLRALF
ncbi:MAG: MerR family transcriptional regulator [Bdellovibrionales bacterium]|nr:MerR family transcriptional regulator [Bdellovibrionales bacterium]